MTLVLVIMSIVLILVCFGFLCMSNDVVKLQSKVMALEARQRTLSIEIMNCKGERRYYNIDEAVWQDFKNHFEKREDYR